MIVTSADVVPGQNVQVLGLVRGNIVTSRHIGRDMMAGMKELVGGEIKSYTEMTDQARTVAESRMIAEAERLGARCRGCHALLERLHQPRHHRDARIRHRP